MITNDYVVEYMPFAENLAWKKSQTLPRCVSFDELKSAAYFGLINASRRFDSTLGISFPHYAAKHIYGAMIDYLRELRWKHSSLESGEEPVSLYQDYVTIDCLDELETILGELTSLEKSIIVMYYQEGFTQKEIGAKMGLGESRISQIIKSALATIHRKAA